MFGTSTNVAGSTSTLPAADDDNKLFLFFVDKRKCKRYLKLVATAGDGTAGTYASAMARLSRAKIGPSTAAEWGADQVLRVG